MKDCKLTRDWIEALRSGEYEQGSRMLRKHDSYCCLGVLCDVSKPETGFDWWKDTRPGHSGRYEFDGEGGVPSINVLRIVGITNSEISTVIEMNDSGKTFPEIADRIEEMIK